MTYFGKFYLCGPDVQKAADYLFISDTNLAINETIETCMLNDNGGVEANCTVTNISAGSAGVVDPIFQGKALYIGTFLNIYEFFLFFFLNNNYFIDF